MMKTGKTTNLQPPASNENETEARDTMGRPVTARKTEVRLGREVQARIGQQLRSMYDHIVSQGVPRHLANLVRRLSDEDDGVT